MALPHSPPLRRSTSPSKAPITTTTRSLPYRSAPAKTPGPPTAAGLTGLKRSRPGTPVHRPSLSHSRQETSGVDSCIIPSSLEDELENGLQDSDSESDGESCCGDQPDSENPVLPEDHRFQRGREPLLRLSRQRAREFISLARYTVPPDNQEPPRKRSRSSSWKPECTGSSDQELDSHDDDEHDDFVVVSPPKGLFHFSCPFYASDPQQHRVCLLKHDLLTPDNVIAHARQHHMKPPYCPVCSQTFDRVAECDNHIIKRACQIKELVLPEGINVYQKGRLVRDDRRKLSNVRRWERINATIFPDQESCPSPYLSSGLELDVSMARDYWKRHGQTVVADFLKEQGMLDEAREDDERAQVALCKLTLHDLLAEMMEERCRA